MAEQYRGQSPIGSDVLANDIKHFGAKSLWTYCTHSNLHFYKNLHFLNWQIVSCGGAIPKWTVANVDHMNHTA